MSFVSWQLSQTNIQFIDRYYIQPQWIFDCVNFRRLLPVEDYFVGADLPPHISPFANERAGEYIPPERKAQMASEENDDEFSSGIFYIYKLCLNLIN